MKVRLLTTMGYALVVLALMGGAAIAATGTPLGETVGCVAVALALAVWFVRTWALAHVGAGARHDPNGTVRASRRARDGDARACPDGGVPPPAAARRRQVRAISATRTSACARGPRATWAGW